MNQPKSVLVTGNAGFIGSEFVKYFEKRFPKTVIVGIDDLSEGREDVITKSTVFYKGSILDEKLLAKIFSKHKPEYVFHFAARPRVSFSVAEPVLTSEVNVVGTVALLKAAKDHGVKRFIFSSSSSVYGGAKKLPTKESENVPSPKSPYALQKYASELFCEQFSRLFGLETVCLRYFNAYGPGQYGDSAYITVIAAWLESYYFPKNKIGFIEGNGTQSRDFSYIDDIAAANICAMQAKGPIFGDVFNISSGKRFTLKQIRSMMEKGIGEKLVLEQRGPRVGDVRHTLADISKAKKVLGYKPSTKFEDGLANTIKWFQGRKAASK